MEYANDVGFINEKKQPLEDLLPTAGLELQDVNLFMNKAMTHKRMTRRMQSYAAKRSRERVKDWVHYSEVHLTSQLDASWETLLSIPTGSFGSEDQRSP